MTTIKQLNQAEQQIQSLLTQNESNWKTIAKIAITVQQQELFKQAELNSFTAWVKAVAKKCDRQPSLIWRYIKAAKYYLKSVDSDDIEQVDEAKAPPEALEKLEKVQRNAPQPVFEKLREKVLAGEATVKECRKIEQEYRPEGEQLRRGRPPKGQEGSYQHLGQAETESKDEASEVIDITAVEVKQLPRQLPQQLPQNQIAVTIARSLSNNLVDWTMSCLRRRYPPYHHQEHTEVRVNFERRRLRLDFLAVLRWSYKRPKDVFAVEIKSCLADFEADNKWENYLNFCHYFCFAIPHSDEELKEAIEIQTDAGILLIDLTAEIQEDMSYPVTVYRQPQKLKGQSVSLVYETLYERILGWSGSDTTEVNNLEAK
jgi:hypothetical protein